MSSDASATSPASMQQAEQLKVAGNAAYKARQYVEAADAYTSALLLRPDWPAVLANRAAAMLKMKRYDDVDADCTAALRLQPKYAKALMRRASARYELGRMRDADADAAAGLALDPTNKELLAVQAKVRRALYPQKPADNWPAAAAPASSTAKENRHGGGGSPRATAAAAATHRGVGARPPGGACSGVDGADTGSDVSVAAGAGSCGSSEVQAVDDGDDDEPLQPLPEPLEQQALELAAGGDAALSAGDHTRSGALYREALDLAPGCAQLYCRRGELRIGRRLWELAELDASVALALEGGCVDALLVRATARRQRGDLQGAREDLTAVRDAGAASAAQQAQAAQQLSGVVAQLVAARRSSAAGNGRAEYQDGAVVIEEEGDVDEAALAASSHRLQQRAEQVAADASRKWQAALRGWRARVSAVELENEVRRSRNAKRAARRAAAADAAAAVQPAATTAAVSAADGAKKPPADAQAAAAAAQPAAQPAATTAPAGRSNGVGPVADARGAAATSRHVIHRVRIPVVVVDDDEADGGPQPLARDQDPQPRPSASAADAASPPADAAASPPGVRGPTPAAQQAEPRAQLPGRAAPGAGDGGDAAADADAAALKAAATVALNAGDAARAEELLSRCLEAEPAAALALAARLNRSVARAKLGMQAGVVSDCTTVLSAPGASDADRVKALARRADALVALRQRDAAQADYEEALRVDPRNDKVIKRLQRLLQQQEVAERLQGRAAERSQRRATAAADAPHSAAAADLLQRTAGSGAVLAGMAEAPSPEPAAPAAAPPARVEPPPTAAAPERFVQPPAAVPEAFACAGDGADGGGSEARDVEAAEAARRAGNDLYNAKRYREALGQYDRCCALDGDSAEGYANRALVQNALGLHAEAERDCDRVLQLQCDARLSHKALHRRAVARRALGKLQEAFNDYLAVLKHMRGSNKIKAELDALVQEMKRTDAGGGAPGQANAAAAAAGRPAPAGGRLDEGAAAAAAGRRAVGESSPAPQPTAPAPPRAVPPPAAGAPVLAARHEPAARPALVARNVDVPVAEAAELAGHAEQPAALVARNVDVPAAEAAELARHAEQPAAVRGSGRCANGGGEVAAAAGGGAGVRLVAAAVDGSDSDEELYQQASAANGPATEQPATAPRIVLVPPLAAAPAAAEAEATNASAAEQPATAPRVAPMPAHTAAPAAAKAPAAARAPAKRPRTVADFELGLRRCGRGGSALIDYVASVEPEAYPKLFKEALTAQHVSAIASALADGLAEVDPPFARRGLASLAGVPRFGVIVRALDARTKARLRQVIDIVCADDVLAQQELQQVYLLV